MNSSILRFFTVLFFLPISLIAQQGVLKGVITDQAQQPLPFVNVYVKGTTNGTTANEKGEYQLTLPYGEYLIVYQLIGYAPLTKQVSITTKATVSNVSLSEEALQLNEVVINTEDNPADRIIRLARQNRKKYAREVDSFSCKVYLKGLNQLDKAPEKVMGVDVEADTGIVYFSESVSELYFKQPNQFKERMIASKVSGNSQGFSFNQASGIQANFYENLVGTDFTERGLVSPIASNCFQYYDYEFVGTLQEDAYLINKIQVIPKRTNDPTFEGYIYIVEDSWRIHSVDLKLDKNKVSFIEAVSIEQQYSPIKENLWVVLSQRYTFEFSAFGFKGDGYFLSVYTDYTIQPNVGKRFFNNEVLTVVPDANKKDSTYWQQIRPVPLTVTEVEDYRTKDSLETIKATKAYKDSIDQRRNRISVGEIFLSGYTYQNTYEKYNVSFGSLLSTLQYNTVEGWVIDWKNRFTRRWESRKSISITPTLRYGFSNTRFNAKLAVNAVTNPLKNEAFTLRGGRYISQFNANEPITPLVNTISTLLSEQNFMKIYQKDFGELLYRRELVNGILFTGSLSYENRNPLNNTSDYTLIDQEGRTFTSNVPTNVELASTAFDTHQALRLAMVVKFSFNQQYISRPNRKINLGSKYPELFLVYVKGLPSLGSDVDYDRLEARITYDVKLGLLGESSYYLAGGYFPNSARMFFPDYKHFEGNQVIFARNSGNRFQLLDYYEFSTTRPYAIGRFQHNFNGFFLNRVPLIKKLRLQEVFTFNYLRTETNGNYVEIGTGIEHIFKVIRVDHYWSFLQGERRETGFRIGLGF